MKELSPKNPTRERFLIPAHGPDVAAVKWAIEALALLCEKHKADGVICVPALKHAEDTVLNQAIPEAQIKILVGGKSLKLDNKQNISMCSPVTFKNYRNTQIVLALFASADMIKKIEESYGCKALVVVPWIPEDSSAWSAKYSPIVLTIPVANG